MAVDRAELRYQLIEASKLQTSSRVQRLIRSPVKSLTPVLMRKLRIQHSIDTTTIIGGNFSGLLPEAVTSFVWRFGYFDLNVCLSLLEFLKIGDTFIDVGAHFGFFSLMGSDLVGPKGSVLSVEAMPNTFDMLESNMKSNAKYRNFTLFEGAAFNKDCKLDFKDYGVVASSLNSAIEFRGSNRSLITSNPETVSVSATSLNQICHSTGIKIPNVIKIDAESSELFVLAGMERILKDVKPIVIIEVGEATESNDTSRSNYILRFMTRIGYHPHFWAKDHTLQRLTSKADIPYNNLTFIPNV